MNFVFNESRTKVHAKWSQRVYQEFFRQGDEERRLFLSVRNIKHSKILRFHRPKYVLRLEFRKSFRKNFKKVGALNDRTKVDLPKSQLGCISFLIMPMVEPLFKFFGTEAIPAEPLTTTQSTSILPADSDLSDEHQETQTNTGGHRASVMWAPDITSPVVRPGPPAIVHTFLHEMQNALYANQQSWKQASGNDSENADVVQIPTTSASGKAGTTFIKKPETSPSVMGFKNFFNFFKNRKHFDV